MEPRLAEFIQKEYKDVKSDLFSAFMEYIPRKTNKNGQIGLVTPFVWMFIKSYEELRNQIINNSTLSSIIQLEYNAFEAACVPVATFTLRNYRVCPEFINEKYLCSKNKEIGEPLFSTCKNTFIFPIFFLYRHYIELSIKKAYMRIKKCKSIN